MLTSISRERIGQELRWMLGAGVPDRGRSGVLIHELNLDAPVFDEPHRAEPPVMLSRLTGEAGFTAALAAWALDRHLSVEAGRSWAEALQMLKGAQVTQRWRKALVLSNEESDSLRDILRALPSVAVWGALGVAQKKRMLARVDWRGVRAVFGAFIERFTDTGFDLGALDREAMRLVEEGVAPTPLVTGDDLLAAGMHPGPKFKGMLEQVYDAQLEGRITTREDGVALARSLLGA